MARSLEKAMAVMTRFVVLCLGVSTLANVAFADDLAPGLWELSLEARVEAEPDFQAGPFTVNQCVTQKDTSDLSKVLAPLTTAEASDCNYTEKRYDGKTFRFALQCSGTLHLKTTGE